MSYKNIYAKRKERGNDIDYDIHLWSDEGYEVIPFKNFAFIETTEDKATHRGLKGEYLERSITWQGMNNTHCSDLPVHTKFLIDKYGKNDTPSVSHKEVFFDIEIEIGGALTPDYIKEAPMPVTSIAYWYKQKNEWVILIWDKEDKLKYEKKGNKEIVPFKTEKKLLQNFIERFIEISPDILVGYNSDYFDIPYLYHRIKKLYNKKTANLLSPINIGMDQSNWNEDQPIRLAGVTSLDYFRLHKKYSFRDEPSYKLDSLGEKYVGLGKVEYEGSLDRLFETDIEKFIEYNFRDVEILQKLDEKFQYLGLTKNLAHKGKIPYDEVYHSSRIHDGAISAYLMTNGIIPPDKDKNPIRKSNYAGGYLFCPKAGLYNYMFDLDLTSLYPSIIMSLNIGKETLMGRILDDDDRNNRLGLNDLEKRDYDEVLDIELPDRSIKSIKCGDLVAGIKARNWSISANGVMFTQNKKSVLSTILKTWFDERVVYKGEMKKAYKAGDIKNGELNHLKQYTMKILLNSLYGATALATFRYGNVYLSEAITLSGQRIIQESALFTNRHMNNLMREGKKL